MGLRAESRGVRGSLEQGVAGPRACYLSTMKTLKIKARDGKVYEVSAAPPGGAHEVRLDGANMGSFVLLPEETKVTTKNKGMTEILLVDIADRFVAAGGAPMGIAK